MLYNNGAGDCPERMQLDFKSRNQERLDVMWTDVDVVEPDEKSIVTYVSLLYDTFPNVPSLEQSLRDNVCNTAVFCLLFSLKFS